MERGRGMYLRKKIVHGKRYFSIVCSRRVDGKVKQETVEYLGNAAKAYEILSAKSAQPPYDHFLKQLLQEIGGNATSPLLWFGGKARMAKQIISFFPPHTCYVEVFGGAAHVLAQKPPSKVEVYNDISKELLHFMQMIQSHPEALQERCKQFPYSRVLQQTFQQEAAPKDPLERAARFFYLNRSSLLFGNANSYFETKGGSFRSSPLGKEGKRYHNSIEKMKAFAQRLQEVVLENQSFEKILKRYDSPQTLFYLDPPYYQHEMYYDGSFTWQDHKRLHYLLTQIRGKFILSYGEHPSIKALYRDFFIRIVPGYKQVIGQGTFRTNELIIDNFSKK